jgi:predicted AAA+ superfamily ATPase
MFERIHLQTIRKRLLEQRRFIQVILGPRQVGKTTMIGQLIEKMDIPVHFVSADAIASGNTSWLIQQWEAARIKMKQQEAKEGLLIIDEIQKLDNWSETVKLMWDKDTMEKVNLKLIILGSARLLLQQGLTESLAGRFETTYMGHWSYQEMADAFGFTADQYVWFGGYPGSAPLIHEELRWKQYVRDALIETSISKDILMLTRVDKPALMKQLFELGCLYSGQILSYNKMIGQLQDVGNSTTLSHYLELLNTAGLLAGIPKYSPNLIRQRASSPKLMVHNTALISAQRRENFKDIRNQPDEWGRWVESAIGAHLLNLAFTGDLSLYYWREGNDEVDFVVQNNNLTAIEVKSGKRQARTGLEKFRTLFNPDKLLLVGDNALSWQEFLKLDSKVLNE